MKVELPPLYSIQYPTRTNPYPHFEPANVKMMQSKVAIRQETRGGVFTHPAGLDRLCHHITVIDLTFCYVTSLMWNSHYWYFINLKGILQTIHDACIGSICMLCKTPWMQITNKKSHILRYETYSAGYIYIKSK